MPTSAPPIKRVTLNLPQELLEAAQEYTGEGVTQTITEGLKRLRAERAYEGLLDLEGKIDLELDLDALREDRKHS